MYICNAPSTVRPWLIVVIPAIAMMITLTYFKDYSRIQAAEALLFWLSATKCNNMLSNN